MIIFTQLEKDDWKHLHDQAMGRFLDGSCYEFAIALHRALSWPLYGIMAGGTIRHTVVRPPSNFEIWRDVRGAVTEQEVRTPFGIPAASPIVPVSEDEVRNVREVNERGIAFAEKMAQRLWPELPWKNSRDHRRMEFLVALEEISKAHGVWVRSPVPGAPPHLEDAHGDEKGYHLRPTSDGLGYVFDRLFK